MIAHFATHDATTIALAVSFLLCAFLANGKFRLGQTVRYYVLQSVFLAAMLTSMAWHGDSHLYFSAAGVLLCNVLVIPMIITLSSRRSGTSGRLSSLVRPTPSYFLSGLMLLLAAVVGMSLQSALGSADLILVVTAFAAMFLGAAMMSVRRDLYSQMIGFLTLENGISILIAATLVVLPFGAELGLAVTVTLGALLMSLLSRRLKELYAVEDTGAHVELVD